MTLRCSGRCAATFEADAAHVAFLRGAARLVGWGCRVEIHTMTGAMRHRDLCPVHYRATVRRAERRRARGDAWRELPFPLEQP